MNFKQKSEFVKNGGNLSEMTAHSHMRKSKAYGLVAGTILTGAAALGGNMVSADEVSTPDTTAVVSTDSTSAADTSTQLVEATTDTTAATSGVEISESTITNDTDTGIAATNLTEAAGVQSDAGQVMEDNANTVQGTTPVTVDQSELTDAAAAAEQAGVNVTVDSTSTASTTSTAAQTSEALASISAQDHTTASQITSTANAYSTAYSNWVETKTSIVAFNANLEDAHQTAVTAYNNFVDNLNSDTAQVVNQYKDAIIHTTEQVQTSADGKTIEGYMAYVQKLAETQSINDSNIAAYMVAKSEYDSTSVLHESQVSTNASLSASVVAQNQANSESAASTNASLSASAAAVVNANASQSASVEAYNKSQQDSAASTNASLSASASAASYSTAASTSVTNKAEVDAYNKSVMTKAGLTWTGDIATDSATVAAYNADVAGRTHTTTDASGANAYTEANNQVAANYSGIPNDTNHSGYTPSGTDTAIPGLSIGSIKVVATGGLGNPTVTVYDESGQLDDAHIISSINWTDQTPEPIDGGTVVAGASDFEGTYTYTNASKIFTVQTKKWYKLAGAATTADGSTHDVYIMFDTDTKGLLNEGSDHLVIWNQNGSISAQDGYQLNSVGNGTTNDGIRTAIAIDSPTSNNEKYLFANIVNDLDQGQYIDYKNEQGDSIIIEVGGGIDHQTLAKSNTQLGETYGINAKSGRGLDGTNSLPDGAVLMVTYSSVYTNVIRNQIGGTASAVVRSDFGSQGQANFNRVKTTTTVDPEISLKEYTTVEVPGETHTETYTPVTPDVKTYNPADTSYTPVTPEVVTYNPIPVTEVPEAPELNLTALTAAPDPTFLEIPNAPEVPTVTYHLTKLNTQQLVQKSVQNEDGTNINNQSVAKGSTNTYTLNPFEFSANRQMTTSAVASDYIQDGIEINLTATVNANKGYEVSYDSATRLLSFTATSETLAAINADRTKEYDVVSPTIVFSVQNDAATYKNTFRWDINGGATGNVNVEYYVEGTTTKLGQAVDLVNETVGNDYDTTDHKLTTITKDGKTYERVTTHVDGNETGQVVEGTTTIKYYYKEVTQTPNTGDVVVHYKDEDGNIISKDVNDVTDGTIDSSYDTTDNKPTKITTKDGVTYELVPTKTVGNETGKVSEGVTEITYVYKRTTPVPTPGGYTTYSNTVTIYTPGSPDNPNDPDNPNGPGNEKIQPVKNNTNEDGENINNKEMLQNSVNHYVAEWDLDQYINDKSSKSAIAKGFAYIDDFQDDALTPNESDFKVVTGKGEEVKGLTYTYVESLDTASTAIKQLVAASGVTPVGSFLIWTADDPQSFYDTYVQTGTDIFFNLPMTVKEGFTGNYTNIAYQIDFGNGYVSNIVENNVPNLVPQKDVIVDGSSVNGGTVAYGQEFQYKLSGVVLPADRGDSVWQYDFSDDYDQTGDKFLGTYKVVATTDIQVKKTLTLSDNATFDYDVTLANGTVVKAGTAVPKGTQISYIETIAKGTDLTEYTTMEHDEENGIIYIRFTKDFLDTVQDSSEFGADAFIDMKRIAYGTFENTYINTVNGVEYKSNTVTTSTPEPEKPETPATPATPAVNTPVQTPVAETPVQKAAALPSTGEADTTNATIVGLGTLTLGAALAGYKRKQKD